MTWKDMKLQKSGAWVTDVWSICQRQNYLDLTIEEKVAGSGQGPAKLVLLGLLLQWELTLNRTIDVIKPFSTDYTVERWLGGWVLLQRVLRPCSHFFSPLFFCCPPPSSLFPVTCNSKSDWWFVCGTLREVWWAVTAHKWCLFSSSLLTWLECDANEAQVMVSISVQTSMVNSAIFTCSGWVHNLIYSVVLKP